MSTVSGRIIAENYDSVVAAQDMKESLERQDSAALFDLLGQHDRARRQMAEHRATLRRRARQGGGEHHGDRANPTRSTRSGGTRRVLPPLRRVSERLRRSDAAVLPVARTAVRHGPGRVRWAPSPEPGGDAPQGRRSVEHRAPLVFRDARAGARLMAAGIGVEVGLSNAIVGPVRQLTQATTRLASGELDTAVPVRSGDEIGALAVGFNRMAERIRELRRSDMGKLLVAQQTTEAAIDSLYDPVIVTDSEGLVTRINPAAERLFGPRADTLGKSIEAVARDPRIAQSVTDVLHSQVPVASEDAAAVLPWAVDGARRAFRIRSTPMKDADLRLVGVVTLLEDITHLSEVSRLKSEFIAAASHELRTPLTSVQMGIHLLLEGTAGPLDDRQQEILQVCREDTARLDRLMRELLDLSKIESGAVTPELGPVRPATLLADAVNALRLQVEARGIRLDVDAPPDLPHVSVDRSQIDRVIGNLITNAMRATPAGGTITVSAVPRGDEVAISVADTGTGIPRDYLPRIFEPFVQVPHASGGGAGLGLTISRRIVEAHGGRLMVQSEPGHGSTFTFTVRAAGPSDEGLTDPARTRGSGGRVGRAMGVVPGLPLKGRRPMKLLIIDDEPHIRHMMRLTLEAVGYQVDEAADGQAGLDRFRDGGEYDAVVLDQKMPGLDGLETLQQIKERTPDACVVMATAFASIELAVDAMRLGATDFLRKPMTPQVLRSAVAAAIASKPSRRPLRRGATPRPSGPPDIATLTLNGFQILGAPGTAPPSPHEHQFRVRHVPDGAESIVTVAVDPEAVERVTRLTHRRLEPGSSFWRLEAERLLSAYLWSEGKAPADGRLTVLDVSREDLDVASRWDEGESPRM